MCAAASDCWYLTGPTASGKTTIGLALARLIDAEIVSLDSMALYREMDIGTAKATAKQRAAVPHHLIDIIDPTGEFNLSAYVDAAHAKIAEIRARGKEVLFTGGTPLYLKALLRGIFKGPAADWDYRHQVEKEAREVGTQALHERLKLVDPLSAARLHPNDVRRIVRALEVHKVTGQPISHLQLQFDEPADVKARRVFVLQWPRAQLRQRIDERVQRMFREGLVEEVHHLLGRYRQLGRTASQAVGYRETIAFIRDECSEQETIDRIKSHTHRFARRQLTWFRSLSECRSIAQHPTADPVEVAQRIVETAG